MPAAGSAAHVLRHPLEKQAAVRESGERIVVGEVIEPLLLFDVIDRERDVAGQFRQQLHLVSSKNPISLAYSTSTPTAVSETSRGSVTSE